MDYREKFYAEYVSKNTAYLYGKLSVADIKKQFVVWKKYFAKFLPSDKQASIIELGCGNGGLLYWLQSIGYSGASGIDASIEQVECAKSLGAKNVIQASLIDFLRGKSEIYDVIFLRDVIEHFKKDEILDILDRVYKSLKKGGTLIIQTPNGAGVFGSRYRYHDFTHEVVFTENSLRQVLLTNNFLDLEFYETRPVIFGVKSFIRAILWKLLRLGLQFYLLVETGASERILTQNIIAIAYKNRGPLKKILFVADLNEYGRSLQRYQTLIDLGYSLKGISTVPIPWRPTIDSNFFEKITWRLKLPFDATGANRKIKKELKKEKFDIVWIEKGLTIRPATLKFVKKNYPFIKLASCSEDDMFAKHNRTFFYDGGLSYYDIVFTTKIYNLEELKSLGARRTKLFLDAYDEKLHRPMELLAEDKNRFSCDVCFMGSFETERAMSMLDLAKRGIKIVVWGNDWGPWVGKHPNLIIKNEHLYSKDYVKAINATKINLCYLRKINRDEITSRSVEIPACGGFMIAERTKRHLEFFKEGEEAIFFSTQDELFNLIKKYLSDNEARKKIAEAGRKRVEQEEYNHRTQLIRMLSLIK